MLEPMNNLCIIDPPSVLPNAPSLIKKKKKMTGVHGHTQVTSYFVGLSHWFYACYTYSAGLSCNMLGKLILTTSPSNTQGLSIGQR